MNSLCLPQLVVGAGLPGITASLALARLGHKVWLLDSATEIGGLLRSYETDGYPYDYGTHFASCTGTTELDQLLFGGFESEWLDIPVLKAGNFWNGVLNDKNDNPDLTTFSREIHDRCLAEILSAPGYSISDVPVNAKEFIRQEYGSCLIENFFDPVLIKLCGLPSESLSNQVIHLFNLRRFAVLNPLATVELKSSIRYDEKISFHHRNHFHGHRPCLYPRFGGIGAWIDQLESKLKVADVKLMKGSHIDHIEVLDNRVIKVIANDVEIAPSNVFWAASPAFFCHLAGINNFYKPPKARATILVGLECDHPFLSDCHYLTIYDPSYSAFRVTLYDNFRYRGISESRHVVTVEFIVDPGDKLSCDWIKLAEVELRRMGLIHKSSSIVSRHHKFIANGFPVHTNSAMLGLAAQAESLGHLSNVHLIGRASGKGWFMHELINHAFSLVSQNF